VGGGSGWREELGWVLSSGEASEIKPSAMLKVKVLHFLCEEACASAAMHVLVDQRLEKLDALRKLHRVQL
jgi:hypothetical protein